LVRDKKKGFSGVNCEKGTRVIGGLDERILLQLVNFRNEKYGIEVKPKRLVKQVLNLQGRDDKKGS
jgi:hypothetical protein